MKSLVKLELLSSLELASSTFKACLKKAVVVAVAQWLGDRGSS